MALFYAGALVTFGLALFMSRNRRRAIITLGYTILLVGLATPLALFISNLVLERSAEERIVVRDLIEVLGSNLEWQAGAS